MDKRQGSAGNLCQNLDFCRSALRSTAEAAKTVSKIKVSFLQSG
jgi:hypothetical protein